MKKFICILCLFFVMIPFPVYAAENLQPYILNPDDGYIDSESKSSVLFDDLADFYVSVFLEDCYNTGFLTEDDTKVFVFFNKSYSGYYPSICICKSFLLDDGVIRCPPSGYREYYVDSIFSSAFRYRLHSFGSAGSSLFYLSDLSDFGNSSPYRYYCDISLGDLELKKLPEPLKLDEAYQKYFGSSGNITFVDFTKTNKILNNIFVLIVFIVLYAWFVNPCLKLLKEKEK